MTLVATAAGGALSTWYTINPTTGTNNVVVNFSANSNNMGSAVSYTGTDRSDSFATTSTNHANSGNPSVSITTTTDNSVIDDNVYYDLSQTLTPNSPEVSQNAEGCGGGSGEVHSAGTLTTTTHGANTLRWTHSGSDSDWQELAVEVTGLENTTSTTSNVYVAKIDDGSYNTYTFSNNTWIVYDKKGIKYTYGSDDTGRMYDTTTGTSTKTYKWMLQEVRDTNDNYIKYTYNRDNNTLYPYKITYTGHGSTDGISTITFATSTRADIRVRYDSGFVATSTKLISEVDALVNGTTVRKYPLTYGVGDNGYRSLLASVQQEGYDDNNNLTTLPPMTFGYATTSKQFYAPATVPLANAAYVVGDVDGDGINDTSYFDADDTNGSVIFDNGSSASLLTVPAGWTQVGGTPAETGTRLLDVNGDGKADVVKGLLTNPGSVFTSGLYINSYVPGLTGYGWTASTTYPGSIPIFSRNRDIAETTGIFGNFNGDGLPDYVQNITGIVGSYLGNGSAWDSTSTICAAAKPFPDGVSGPTETASQLVDVNGDGLDDWVYSQGGNMYVLLNNGTGWNASPSPQWTIATSTLYQSGASFYDRGIRFIDLNGDGLPDFVRSYQQTGSTCSGSEIATVKAVYLKSGRYSFLSGRTGHIALGQNACRGKALDRGIVRPEAPWPIHNSPAKHSFKGRGARLSLGTRFAVLDLIILSGKLLTATAILG